LTVSSYGGLLSAHFLFYLPRILRKLLTAAKRYGFENAWKNNWLHRERRLTVPHFLLTGGGV
jgi:hypothetical protein